MEEATQGRSQGSVQPDAKAGSGENLLRCFLLGQEAADERVEPGSSTVTANVSVLRSTGAPVMLKRAGTQGLGTARSCCRNS